MKISVVTAVLNGATYLEQAIQSVIQQRQAGVEIEYIIADGGSTDDSRAIIARHRDAFTHVLLEPDRGPAQAINKCLRLATGDILCWLNADDTYAPGALARVVAAFELHPTRALCFGTCRIVDETGAEIRRGITRFKEAWFPISCRFAIQCINYISQPAMFFRRAAFECAGPLREDLKAAWDYDLTLRLWRQGGAVALPAPPLASFRWHAESISGRHFGLQFREDWQAAARDAGRWSPQALVHLGTWWGIVSAYTLMAMARRARARTASPGTGAHT